MSKNTPRDKVWSYALMQAFDYDSAFKVKHVRKNLDDPPSDRTIRDVLNTMVDHGWLRKEKKQSRTWHTGPEAEKLELVSHGPGKANDEVVMPSFY